MLSGGIGNLDSRDIASVYLHENIDGLGDLQKRDLLDPEGNRTVYSVFAADLDGDEDQDVIFSDGHDTSWLENDSHGTFKNEHHIGPSNRSIFAADLDGDGDVDVIPSHAGGSWAWYENTDGEGTFQRVDVRTVDNDVLVLATDVDGDGDEDILLGGHFDKPVMWYESRLIGDSNDDGVFNSGDLVRVFQVGKYEDGIDGNANFDEGDWNQDGDFDSSDLVAAFKRATI